MFIPILIPASKKQIKEFHKDLKAILQKFLVVYFILSIITTIIYFFSTPSIFWKVFSLPVVFVLLFFPALMISAMEIILKNLFFSRRKK